MTSPERVVTNVPAVWRTRIGSGLDGSGIPRHSLFRKDNLVMNQPPDDAISGYLRVSTRRPNSAARRRKVRPFLEFLERREVLSTFTWTGGASNGNWDNSGNWLDGSEPPKTGLADIVLQSTAQNQTISLQ